MKENPWLPGAAEKHTANITLCSRHLKLVSKNVKLKGYKYKHWCGK